MDEVPNMLEALLGRNAVRVPAWCFVQDQGRDPRLGPVVSFIGASAFAGPDGDHPLMFGRGHCERYTHYLLNGEIIFRSALVLGTNALRGEGLTGLALGNWATKDMLAEGELIRGTPEMLDQIQPDRRRG